MLMALSLLLKMLILPRPILSAIEGNITNNQVHEEVESLKHITTVLSDHLEKWNGLFLNSLEPRMVSTATSLASIDSNINNLQERAHVWDTFQLHVAAWNDQLATIDRKTDIISKGQEKFLEMESKINEVANMEDKLEDALKTIKVIEEAISNIKEQTSHRDHDFLFGEFASRGILSSIKMIERKLDRLLISQQNQKMYQDLEQKPRLTIKCNTPPFVEELLTDISSKVDIIYDKINGKEGAEENDFNNEDYVSDQGTDVELRTEAVAKSLDQLVARTKKIENISEAVLILQTRNLEKIDRLLGSCETNCSVEQQILKSYDVLHKKYFGPFLPNITNTVNIGVTSIGQKQPKKAGCEELESYYRSDVYVFQNVTEPNPKNRLYNKRYCILRKKSFWTVIQRRENSQPQNFNVTWFDYKNGFGDLDGDFWFGNDFISGISKENELVLRIELEDFEGRWVWAEYDKFVVLPEATDYKLIVSGYKGNASDSFSSHNGSVFSTYDKTNDDAPPCCPCAVSYGSGWWFNRCFEANLNGPYYRKGEYNGYYGGIIWENWLGNYSLKKTLMMVRSTKQQRQETSTSWPYYEDP